jgi:hypothetical protein
VPIAAVDLIESKFQSLRRVALLSHIILFLTDGWYSCGGFDGERARKS